MLATRNVSVKEACVKLPNDFPSSTTLDLLRLISEVFEFAKQLLRLADARLGLLCRALFLCRPLVLRWERSE